MVWSHKENNFCPILGTTVEHYLHLMSYSQGYGIIKNLAVHPSNFNILIGLITNNSWKYDLWEYFKFFQRKKSYDRCISEYYWTPEFDIKGVSFWSIFDKSRRYCKNKRFYESLYMIIFNLNLIYLDNNNKVKIDRIFTWII